MTTEISEPTNTCLAMSYRLSKEADLCDARAAQCLKMAVGQPGESQKYLALALARQIEANTMRKVAGAMYDARDGDLNYFHNIGL